ncbi:MAG: hypothetical protein RR459_07580 [Christensenellaceae bacterium]
MAEHLKKTKTVNKKKIALLLIVVVVIAAVIIMIAVMNPFAAKNDAVPTQQPTVQNTPQGIQTPAEENIDDSLKSAETKRADNEYESMLKEPEKHEGETVILEGTIISQPESNQGLVGFEMKVNDSYYVSVSYLDSAETFDFKKGDVVTVEGIVSETTKIRNENDLEETAAIVVANKIEA